MNLNQSLKSIIYLLLTFISSIIFGQEVVDLSNWEQRGDLINGNWVYDNSNNSLRQTTNSSDPTFYVSDNKYLNKAVEGSLKVNTTSDDDMVGFVLGFESAVDNLESINKFLLIDWKQGNQNQPGYGAANAEIRLSYFNTTENDNTVFWETQTANDTWGNIDVYEPSNSFDGVNTSGGWVDNFTYRFKAVYTESNVKIYFDFGNGVYTKVFDVDASSVPFFNSFPDGKFGFYNYSQDQVIYDNFTVPNGNLTVVSSGGGTEGEDWQRTGTTIIPMSSNAKINSSDFESLQTGLSSIKISTDGVGVSNNDYISAMLAFKGMKLFDFGYGYEMGQRTSSTALRANTHQIFMRFKFHNKAKSSTKQ